MKYETKKIEIFQEKAKGQVISSIRFLELQQVLQCSVESKRDRASLGQTRVHGNTCTQVWSLVGEKGSRRGAWEEGMGFLISGTATGG